MQIYRLTLSIPWTHGYKSGKVSSNLECTNFLNMLFVILYTIYVFVTYFHLLLTELMGSRDATLLSHNSIADENDQG
jgi:hypothetical protein